MTKWYFTWDKRMRLQSLVNKEDENGNVPKRAAYSKNIDLSFEGRFESKEPARNERPTVSIVNDSMNRKIRRQDINREPLYVKPSIKTLPGATKKQMKSHIGPIIEKDSYGVDKRNTISHSRGIS